MELGSEAAAAAAKLSSSTRPLANFHPSVWGDQFLHCTPFPTEGGDDIDKRVVEELKEEVKRELKQVSNDHIPLLKLVDAIQRLGVEYHFEHEIDEALHNLSQNFCEQNHDIYATALGFRLLRQHGHRISSEIFDKFREEETAAGFKVGSSASEEALGLGVLEFFEATYLRVRGEKVLDDALVYTRNLLAAMLPGLTNPLAQQVHHALHGHSNRRGITRLEARQYISIYEQYPTHHHGLLRLAKLDFNLIQSMHQRELSDLSRWWKGFGLSTNLTFARDRLVETYYWIVAVYFEPKYSLSRKISAKMQALISIVDDAFDAYGTFEELQLFTQAIDRWSISCLDELPDYMKIFYKGLLELGEEIAEEMNKLGKSYRVNYAIEAIKVMVRDYFVEATWREEKYKPTSEEYMQLGIATCAYTSLTIIAFLCMDDVTKETFDWVLSQPKMLISTCVISRISNDIAGHEAEKKRDHIPSIVEFYMEEHNASKQEAIRELKNQVEESWKDLNEAFLKPTEVAAPLLYRILNFARVIEAVYYKDADWYTHVGPEMQSFIRQLFIDPVA